FVQLEAERARANLLPERLAARSVALAEKPEVQRKRLDRFVHPADVPAARRTGGGLGPGRRPRAAADHRRDARVERVGDLIRRNEMDVRVDGAAGEDVPFG